MSAGPSRARCRRRRAVGLRQERAPRAATALVATVRFQHRMSGFARRRPRPRYTVRGKGWRGPMPRAPRHPECDAGVSRKASTLGKREGALSESPRRVARGARGNHGLQRSRLGRRLDRRDRVDFVIRLHCARNDRDHRGSTAAPTRIAAARPAAGRRAPARASTARAGASPRRPGRDAPGVPPRAERSAQRPRQPRAPRR
jgi:hypothetical protein